MANPIAIAGSNVGTGSLITPGGAQGVQGIQGPTSVSADSGNIAQLGSDNLILVPQATIWNQRLRSFNAIGNPNFEVDQRSAGASAGFLNPSMPQDRWYTSRASGTTMGGTIQQMSENVVVPGTNYLITSKFLRITITTAQASMAAGDWLQCSQYIEGPPLRELINDVHSVQCLVRSSVAGLKFGISLRDGNGGGASTRSLTKLCTIPTANVWTSITLPNIPVFPAAGVYNLGPGGWGYIFGLTFACGTTFGSPLNDSWQNGNFIGAVGQSNFAATLNATFDIAFVQHEPGSQCTTLIDKPFSQNYDECLRYYSKSYDYGTKAGTQVDSGEVSGAVIGGIYVTGGARFAKPMAKVPTVTSWAPRGGGSVNAVFLVNANSQWSLGSVAAGTTGVHYISLGSAPAANDWALWQYSADTGW